MTFYRRRLPHFHEIDQPVFLTWRLHYSLPPHRAFPTETVKWGQAFAAMDRLLDEARAGAVYLRQPAVANMSVEAIHYNANVLGHYQLHAFVVMPNHVHLLATPAVALPKLTKSLKGITARRANAMLAYVAHAFAVRAPAEKYGMLKLHIESASGPREGRRPSRKLSAA